MRAQVVLPISHHVNFEVPSCNSEDMIWPKCTKRHVTLTTPILWVLCHP